ncbi:MAG: GAF domain-containing protein [Hydrogenophilus sp.]|nr:GAF domain-containing protein [Hydrogenophilus sp.]
MWWLSNLPLYAACYLDECESEPIATPGAIQGNHGALLITDPAQRLALAFSANLPNWLSGNWQPDAPLPPPLANWLATLPQREALPQPVPPLLLTEPAAALPLVARLLPHPLGWLIEWRCDPPSTAPVRSSFVAAWHHSLLATAPSQPLTGSYAIENFTHLWNARAQQIVDRVQEETGYHRVLYYRFLPDGAGEVIAEARSDPSVGTYLGLRFPASDIPQIARSLYQRIPWRHIPDIETAPIPLIARDPAAIDLSNTDLRAVSPIHCAYLANMGVRSSTSFPVSIGKSLIALVACHHHDPLLLPFAQLEALSHLVRLHQSELTELHVSLRTHLLEQIDPILLSLLTRYPLDDWCTSWPRIADSLIALFGAHGAHWLVDNLTTGAHLCHHRTGVPLSDEALVALENHFLRVDSSSSPVTIAETLSDYLSPVPPSEAVGFIRIAWNTPPLLRVLYLTRRAELYEVTWAGNPEKPVERHVGGLPIAPRRSFERWVERRLGHCRPWPEQISLIAAHLWAIAARRSLR